MTSRSPTGGSLRYGLAFFAAAAPFLSFAPGAPVAPPADPPAIFARDNLVAWCIVPFDAKKRGPAARVEMLQKLGFRRYAYDWRAEHLPTFDEEVGLLKKAKIELTAVWFPAGLGADAQKLLAVIKKHEVKTQLWVTMGEPAGADKAAKVGAAAKAIRPIAEEAAKLGCSVALYNHGGWFGEPANQVAIVEALGMMNVGIVYNQHHGHDHFDKFPELLKLMKPHLLALNINGSTKGGDKVGKKILPLGQGDLDVRLLKTIAESGYTGPIGILGHTSDDAAERLADNLDGLDWLLPQLAGKPAGAKPKYRTASAPPPAPATSGWTADGKPEYRTAPITVECRAKLAGKGGFNVLVASDTKASAAHWELFTWPGTGHLTVYMPGMAPDHVRSKTDVCDGKWHTIAMQYEAERVRLFVDGNKVADEAVKRGKAANVDGGIAFARLVEGGIGCDGELDRVRVSKGVVEPTTKELTADDNTLALWTFAGRGKPAADSSKLKNHAKPAAVAVPSSQAPPPGPHLTPTDANRKVTLLDRSPDDAYVAVKLDPAGRLFVGGREKVFVFDPDGKGGFGPRRELLRFPPDSIIAGLEFRGDDLYVLAVHGLYLVPKGRVQSEGLAPKRILWGVPLDFHVSFHCLAWGPDGDLYLTHGDPLLGYGDWNRPDHWAHWTLFAGPNGERVSYTGAGAVLKVRPDGSNPRVVARGFRGPVGLAFDPQWNLFTNDNDHESRPDQYAPMRMMHVPPHADFAWPRGWMASKSRDRADLLDTLHPALGRGVPCDLVYQDPGALLMCRWDRFAVTRYPLAPKGAGFTAEEEVFARGANQCRPTGITIDATGRVFVTCHYLGGNVVSPHGPSDLVMISPTTPVPLADETKASPEELRAALSAKAWDTRRRAHLELVRRGKPALAGIVAALGKVDDADPAALHLPWLAAASGEDGASAALIARADDATRPNLRLQSLRALAAFPALKPSAKLFSAALADPNPAVQLAGLEGLFTTSDPLPVDAVAKLAGGEDATLRQIAATLLARTAKLDELAALARSDDARTRLAGVLAIGTRLTVPAPNAQPPAGLKLHFPAKSAFFSPEIRFADSADPVDLTKLGPIGSYTTAQAWAAGTRTADEERLFKLLVATLDDRDDLVGSQSAYYLGWLRDPRAEPAVARVRRELRTRGLTDRVPVPVKEAWQIGRFADATAGAAVERGPIDLGGSVGKVQWGRAAATDKGLSLTAGAGTAYAYFRVQSRERQPALLGGVGDGRVWHNGSPVAAEPDGSVLLDLQPGSNDVLVRTTASGALALGVRARSAVSATLPEKADGATLAERLKAAKGASVPSEFLAIDWSKEGKTGDAERGRKLFGTLGCAKCHAVTADQTGGGAPSLTDAGKRFTPAHLAESILVPDRSVADEFRATRIATTDGQTYLGLVVRESPTEIDLLQLDTTRRVVKAGDVETRKAVAASPMPAGLVKTPGELRDLLTYLSGDRPLPP